MMSMMISRTITPASGLIAYTPYDQLIGGGFVVDFCLRPHKIRAASNIQLLLVTGIMMMRRGSTRT